MSRPIKCTTYSKSPTSIKRLYQRKPSQDVSKILMNQDPRMTNAPHLNTNIESFRIKVRISALMFYHKTQMSLSTGSSSHHLNLIKQKRATETKKTDHLKNSKLESHPQKCAIEMYGRYFIRTKIKYRTPQSIYLCFLHESGKLHSSCLCQRPTKIKTLESEKTPANLLWILHFLHR